MPVHMSMSSSPQKQEEIQTLLVLIHMPNRRMSPQAPKSMAKLIRQSPKEHMHRRLSMDSIRLPACLSSPRDAAQVRRLDEFVELRRIVAPSSPPSPPAATRTILVQMGGLLRAHRLTSRREIQLVLVSLSELLLHLPLNLISTEY